MNDDPRYLQDPNIKMEDRKLAWYHVRRMGILLALVAIGYWIFHA